MSHPAHLCSSCESDFSAPSARAEQRRYRRFQDSTSQPQFQLYEVLGWLLLLLLLLLPDQRTPRLEGYQPQQLVPYGRVRPLVLRMVRLLVTLGC